MYNGVPLIAGAASYDQNANFVNSAVFYLFNPASGSNDLNVNYGASIVGAASAFDAFTLGGVDTRSAETTAGRSAVAADDSGPQSLSVSLSNLPHGSWAASTTNYRLGTAGNLTASITNGTGTLLTNQPPNSANGNLWNVPVPAAGTLVQSAGALVSNITTPSLTLDETGAGASVRFTSAVLAFSAFHPTFVWSGGSSSTNNWTDAANWAGTAPTAGSMLVFSGSTRPGPVNDFAANTNFSSLTFDPSSGPFTLTGGSVFLTGDNSFNGIINQGSNTENVNLNLNLGFDNLTFAALNGELAIGGVISGSHGITVAGTGTVSFGGANTYNGVTNLTGSGLKLNNANAVQSSTVNVGGSSTVQFGNGIVNFNVGGLSGTGGINLNAADNSAANLVVGANNASTSYTGNLTGGGGLTKVGTGTLSISGVNNYSGNTLIQGGTLRIGGRYEFYKFQASQVTGGPAASNLIQLSELHFFDSSLTWLPANSVTDPNNHGNPPNEIDSESQRRRFQH